MEEINKVTLVICSFVLLRELRPIEPFLTSYLIGPPLYLTTEEVNERIYPIGTYSSMMLAVVIFLITDYFRYKPIIILDGITGILTYVLLFGKPTYTIFVIEQIFFGFFFSADVACNTYLYAKIEDTTLYQEITSYVRASSLVGRFFSASISQIAVSFDVLKKIHLIYISAVGMVLTTIVSLFVPSVKHSIYFHRTERIPLKSNILTISGQSSRENMVAENPDVKIVIKSEKLNVVAKRLLLHFKNAYSNSYVVMWSLWWSFSLCGFYFVLTYSQVLWETIVKSANGKYELWNGAVDSIYTISGAGAAYFTGKLHFNWKHMAQFLLAASSLVLSILVLYCYFSENLVLIYGSYVLYGTVFQMTLTLAQSEVAKHLERDSYGLIFGFNSFLALALAGILTYTVIEGNVIYLSTRQQFLFYGIYYAMIGVIFMATSVISILPTLRLSRLSLTRSSV